MAHTQYRYFHVAYHYECTSNPMQGFGELSIRVCEYPSQVFLKMKIAEKYPWKLHHVTLLSIQELTEDDYLKFTYDSQVETNA